MPDSVLGSLAAVATAGCWTVTALAFQAAGRQVGSLAVNIIRLVLAVGFLSAACWLWTGRAWPADASPHAWLWLSISGLVGFSLGDLFLFRAFVVIGARLAMLVMSLVPPLTALLAAAWLGERLGGWDWLGMAVTVAGVSWVVLEQQAPQATAARDTRQYLWGLALALLGAAGQAAGLVLSKYGMGDYHPLPATLIRVLAGLAGFAVLLTAMRWWPQVWVAVGNRAAMRSIGLGAFFGPFLGVTMSLAAVQLVEAGVASTIMSLVPVLIIPPAALLFGERVSPRAAIGAVVAVAGVAILFLLH